MKPSLFSQAIDRSRMAQLEHEIALLMLDFLKEYENGDDEVLDGFLEAGRLFHAREEITWPGDGYEQFIVDDAERLLRLDRQRDGLWTQEPTIADEAVASTAEKQAATPEEIAAELCALCTRFEDRGYHVLQIARALARVGLTFGTVTFIDRKRDVNEWSLNHWKENGRAFLDKALGEDRYPKGKRRKKKLDA